MYYREKIKEIENWVYECFVKHLNKVFKQVFGITIEKYKESLVLYHYLLLSYLYGGTKWLIEKKKQKKKTILMNILGITLGLISGMGFIYLPIDIVEMAWRGFQIKIGGELTNVIEKYFKKIKKILGKDYEYMLKIMLALADYQFYLGDAVLSVEIGDKKAQKILNKYLEQLEIIFGKDELEEFLIESAFLCEKGLKSLLFEPSLIPKEIQRDLLQVPREEVSYYKMKSLALVWLNSKILSILDVLFKEKNEKKRRAWEATKEFIINFSTTVLRKIKSPLYFRLRYKKTKIPGKMILWVLNPVTIAAIIMLLYLEYKVEKDKVTFYYESNGELFTYEEYSKYIKQHAKSPYELIFRIRPDLIVIILGLKKYEEYTLKCLGIQT